MRVLLAHQDNADGHALKASLDDQGYEVDIIPSTEVMAYTLLDGAGKYDVIVLHHTLDDCGGLIALQSMRQLDIKTPVLFLGANSDWKNTVDAYDSGADLYLATPCPQKVLEAYLRAIMRRLKATPAPAFKIGILEINTFKKTLYAGDNPIPLSAMEYHVLETLARSGGKVVNTRDILFALYSDDVAIKDSTLVTMVSRLRHKLAAFGLADYIHTIRGKGYKLCTPDAAEIAQPNVLSTKNNPPKPTL